jgi:hypothetical protein
VLVEIRQTVDHRIRFLGGSSIIEPDQLPSVDALLQDRKILSNQPRIEWTLGDAELPGSKVWDEDERFGALRLRERRGRFRGSFGIGGSARNRGLRYPWSRRGGGCTRERSKRRAKIGFGWRSARWRRRRQDWNAGRRLHTGHARKRKHFSDERKCGRALSVHRPARIR